MKNILKSILEKNSLSPQKNFLIVEDEICQNKDFIKSIKHLAKGLKDLKVKPGDKIALILPNSVSWYELFWAIVSVGAIPVPLDPQVGEWELRELFSLMDFHVCFITSKYRANNLEESLKKILNNTKLTPYIIVQNGSECTSPFMSWDDFYNKRPRESEEILITDTPDGLLMYACTSGTTGNPKIIAVEHAGFYQSQRDMAEYLGLNSKDTMLLGMPLYHQGGFGMGVQAALSGTTLIYQPRFDPIKFLEIIENHKVTHIQLTPTLAKILLTVRNIEQYDLSSLRLAYFAGEVLPDELAARFYEKMNIRVINIIGSSETATMVIWDSQYDKDVKVNDFRTLDFTSVKILSPEGKSVKEGESGRIIIHTDAILREYYKNPQESDKRILQIEGQRWFDTGDLAQLCPNGRIRFIGREKRIIKRGANLIFPEEIESFLLSHPSINAVAVVKKKHEIIGETIEAYIQAAEGNTLERKDLMKFCVGKISSYKIPDNFILTKEIPKDIGKIQYKYLREKRTP